MDKSRGTSVRFPENSWKGRQILKGDRLVKNRVLSWVNPIPGQRFLDIGAGTASFSVEFAKKIECSQIHIVDAVDFSDEWTNLKETTGIDMKGKVHDLEDPLPYPDELFDVVLSNHVVEHLYDPVNHLKEIKRVLASSGFAIVGTCNLSSIQYRLELLLGLTPNTLMVGLYKYKDEIGQETPNVTMFDRHISCFAFRDFKKLLQSIGFSIVKARTSVIYLLPDFLEGMITCLLPLGNYMTFVLRKPRVSP